MTIDTALDTSNGASLAIARDGALVLEAYLPAVGRDSDSALVPWLQARFADAGLTPDQVTRWTVGTGPGSFSGLRVGISLVMGLCLPGRTPCRGLPSSLALAWQATRLAPAAAVPGAHMAVLHDARRRQIILSLYANTDDGAGLRLTSEPAVHEAADILPHLEEATAIITAHGAALLPLFPDSVARRVISVEHVEARWLLAPAGCPWPTTEAERQASCQPVYVRPPVFVAPRPVREV